MKAALLFDKGSEQIAGIAASAVGEAGWSAELVPLCGRGLNPCLGCFQCWTKTPGLCINTGDSANLIAEKLINSDAAVLLSESKYGGYSYETKSFLDRMIPVISPFMEIVDGEMHHEMRYSSFPYLIAIGHGFKTHKEAQTFIALADRNAKNMRPLKHFAIAEQDTALIPGKLAGILSKELLK
ncbi:MAG: hypothetical protein FWG10_11425 [Eubacteriaceae bacterium]|nr:hypothetical protein [Eubacteriaceae bacterium]